MKKLFLTTERLVIRELTAADAQLLYEYSRELAAREELPDEVQENLQQALETIEYMRSRYGQVYHLVYALAEQVTGILVGHISLSEIPEGIEIGYAVSEKYQGRGYAAEAIEAFSRWAVMELGIEKLFAIIKEKNLPSRRAAEKAGYQLAALQQRDFLGKDCRTAIYVFTAQNPPDNG